RLTFRRFNRNFPGRSNRADPLKSRDLVCLHQSADAAGKRFHHLVFPLLHLWKIDLHAIDHDAVFGGFLFCEHDMVALSGHAFAWDAAHMQASSAEFLVFLDNGGFQTELPGADRSDVAARSGTDNYNIKFFHMSILSLRPKWRHLLLTKGNNKRYLDFARHDKDQRSSGSFFGSSIHSFTFMRKVTASFPSMAR